MKQFFQFPISRNFWTIRSILEKSIELRNPYVDPLSYLQVQFLKKVRGTGEQSDALQRQSLLDYVLMSINGVASGLQSTG